MPELFLGLLVIAGWLGAGASVTAFALASVERIQPTSALFQALNMTGSSLLAVSAAVSDAWPAAAVNALWLAVSVYALLRARRKRLTLLLAAHVPVVHPSPAPLHPPRSETPHD